MNCSLQLNESTSTNVPEHFKVLIENLMIERAKFKKVYKELPKCLHLEYELCYCVAVTVALETGFRLENNPITMGFDVRALRALTSFEQFRDVEGRHIIATLYLPNFMKWEFRIIGIPILKDLILYDVVAMEENEVRLSSSFAIPCNKYIALVNKGLEMFKDLKGLSEIYMKEFRKIRNETHKMVGFNYCNLHGLPDELKRLIFYNLPAQDFVNLCLSSKDMLRFIKDFKLWSYYLTRDFKIEPPDEVSSFQTYKNIMNNQVRMLNAETSNFSGITVETEDD